MSVTNDSFGIIYSDREHTASCALCGYQFHGWVGPVLTLQGTGEPVCESCGRHRDPRFFAMWLAAAFRYREFLPRSESGLSLQAAMSEFPHGCWIDRTGESWGTDQLFRCASYENRAAPCLDFEQPVLWIGRALYPALPLTEPDVEPLLTLDGERNFDASLDSLLHERKHMLWLDRSGWCWEAETLRSRLLLQQRATEMVTSQFIYNKNTGADFEIITTKSNQPLFVLVDAQQEPVQAVEAAREADPAGRWGLHQPAASDIPLVAAAP